MQRQHRDLSQDQSTDTVTFSGVISAGRDTRFSVAGEDICLSEKTWVFGDMKVGATAKVTGSRDLGAAINATKIIIQR